MRGWERLTPGEKVGALQPVTTWCFMLHHGETPNETRSSKAFYKLWPEGFIAADDGVVVAYEVHAAAVACKKRVIAGCMRVENGRWR